MRLKWLLVNLVGVGVASGTNLGTSSCKAALARLLAVAGEDRVEDSLLLARLQRELGDCEKEEALLLLDHHHHHHLDEDQKISIYQQEEEERLLLGVAKNDDADDDDKNNEGDNNNNNKRKLLELGSSSIVEEQEEQESGGRRRRLAITYYVATDESSLNIVLDAVATSATPSDVDLGSGVRYDLEEQLVLASSTATLTLRGEEVELASVGSPHRIMNVTAGSSVVLQGPMTLRDGVAYGTGVDSNPEDRGGCVYVGVAATLTVRRTTLANCTAYAGGGVTVEPTAVFTLDDYSLITHCAAGRKGAGVAAAAATFYMTGHSEIAYCHCRSGTAIGMRENPKVGGEAHLSNSRIHSCTADVSGAVGAAPALGVWMATNTTMSNCSAATHAGGIIGFSTATVLSNSHVVRCSSVFFGGGIYCFNYQDVPAELRLTAGSSVTECSGAAFGGGIYTRDASIRIVLEGRGTRVADCHGGTGGGIYAGGAVSMRDQAEVRRCWAEVGGGILASQQSVAVQLTDSYVRDCVASGAGGGGLAVAPLARVFVLRSELSGNTALQGVGGAIATSGGKIWLMAGSVVRGNVAVFGGAVALSGGLEETWSDDGSSGRLYVSGPKCSFVQLELNFEAATDTSVARHCSVLIQDAASGKAVDERGDKAFATPVAGQVERADFCLKPGRSYTVALSTIRGDVDWADSSAQLLGLFETQSFDESGGLTVPDFDDWESRFTSREAFSLPAVAATSEACELSGNTATCQGGALYLSEGAEVYVADSTFSGNVALGAGGSTMGGGAAYLDAFTSLEAVDSEFFNNSAPEGRGGAILSEWGSAVRLVGSVARNNTAGSAGGFGCFDGSSSVEFLTSTFRHNSLLATSKVGGQGGCAALDAVASALIVDSTFDSNSVLAAFNDGGALSVHDSPLTIRGTTFTNNVAAQGNGGAVVAVGGSAVAWEAQEPSSACTRVEVLVDYSETTEHCGQQLIGAALVCDNTPNRCEQSTETQNPVINDRAVNICAGCSCPFDGLKYFTLTTTTNDDGNSTDVQLYHDLTRTWTTEGQGHSDAVFVYALCLPGGDYEMRAVDELGDGWWGAGLSVHVHDGSSSDFAEYSMEDWVGYSSQSVSFSIAQLEPRENFISHNRAAGGGGAVFWSPLFGGGGGDQGGASEEPSGLFEVDTLICEGNFASYGADIATAATHIALQGIAPGEEDDGGLRVTSLSVVGSGSSGAASSDDDGDAFLTATLRDYYDHTVTSDSSTSVFAAVDRQNAEGLDSITGAIAVTEFGVATFDKLAFDTISDGVSFSLDFLAPALGLRSDPLNVVVATPPRPHEEKNHLGTSLQGIMIMLVVFNVLFIVVCVAWTWWYQDRTILNLSQPRMLYLLCLGCFVSTVSSAAPLFGPTTLSCQLMLWLYGCGFVLTTATLYAKMQHMKKTIESSLRIAMKHTIVSNWDILNVMGAMSFGEGVILALWTAVAPLEYKRSCLEEEEGGPWDGACVESIGRCRTEEGLVFICLLFLYHTACVLSGMRMCYKVRNLPSLMAEGKWVFTGFYSQLQIFVTAVPVLALVREDYVAFTLLKSLMICVGDFTTLAMIYLPKMRLVYAYHDFDRGAVARYVIISLSLSKSAEKDAVYESLRVKMWHKRPPWWQPQHGDGYVSPRGCCSVAPEGQLFGDTTRRSGDEGGRSSRSSWASWLVSSSRWTLIILASLKSRLSSNSTLAPTASATASSRKTSPRGGSTPSSKAAAAAAAAAAGAATAAAVAGGGGGGGNKTNTNTNNGSVVEKSLRAAPTRTSRMAPVYSWSSVAPQDEEAGSDLSIKENLAMAAVNYKKNMARKKKEQKMRRGGNNNAAVSPTSSSFSSHSPSTNHTTNASSGSPSMAPQKAERVLGKANHYLHHELKNRLHVLQDVDCKAETRQLIVEELLEIVGNNSGIMRLATGRYLAKLEDLDLDRIVNIRLARYNGACRPIVRMPTTGSAKVAETSLRLDRTLVNIILDNVLSNAFKYGGDAVPPTIDVEITAGYEFDSVDLKLEVRNVAGVGHAKLLAMGEQELNRIAAADGERAHGDHCGAASAGDGFPMAVTSARILGGLLWLQLSEEGIVAKLHLPRVGLGKLALEAQDKHLQSQLELHHQQRNLPSTSSPAVLSMQDHNVEQQQQGSSNHQIIPNNNPASPTMVGIGLVPQPRVSATTSTIRNLTVALVDDSLVQRKRLTRLIQAAFPRAAEDAEDAVRVVIISGQTQSSIDEFPQAVVDADCDLVLTDQNFGLVHHKLGTDLVMKIRDLDEEAGSRERVVFVASANDNAEDVQMYMNAGADGAISKNISKADLRDVILEQAAKYRTRFEGRFVRLNDGTTGGSDPAASSSAPPAATAAASTSSTGLAPSHKLSLKIKKVEEGEDENYTSLTPPTSTTQEQEEEQKVEVEVTPPSSSPPMKKTAFLAPLSRPNNESSAP